MEKSLTRKDFLAQCGMLGAIVILSPLVVKANALADKKVKVGIIGCGSVSNMYLPHLSKCPYVEIVSCCDIVPERAKSQAEKYRIPNHYTHIEQQLAGVPFDLLVNLTDMQEHGSSTDKPCLPVAIFGARNLWQTLTRKEKN